MSYFQFSYKQTLTQQIQTAGLYVPLESKILLHQKIAVVNQMAIRFHSISYGRQRRATVGFRLSLYWIKQTVVLEISRNNKLTFP